MAVALVTGTSSGLGLATAVSLARAGHTVTGTMRNLDGGADLRQIIAKEKLPITLTALDVDDDDSVHDAFAKVVAEHGRSTFWSTTLEFPARRVVWRKSRSTCFNR